MLNELAAEIHENATGHGWWDEPRTFPEIIALCHSELSEALEEYRGSCGMYYCCARNSNAACTEEMGRTSDVECIACMSTKVTNGMRLLKPEGIAIELADCIIRILDYCAHEGIDIDEAIRVKHAYNKTRPYRHGGKVC